MSHELDMSRGKAAVMVAGEAAWHRLGVNVAEAQTSDAAMMLASLDWEVIKEKLFTADGSEVKGHFATKRTDTGATLGVVGSSYRVFQNSDCFDFMDSLVGEALATYETAGALRGGKTVWMMIRIPKEYRVNGTNDVIHPYILLTNSHDGSGALKVLPVSVRVVCANTHRLAMGRAKKGSAFSIRHSESMEGKVQDAREKLRSVCEGFDAWMKQVDALAQVKMTDEQVDAYFHELFPVKYKAETKMDAESRAFIDEILTAQKEEARGVGRELAAEYLDKQSEKNAEIIKQLRENLANERNTLPGIEGSAWAAYNAVSEYIDHQKPSRGKDEAARLDNKVNNMWFGTGNDVKADAFNSAMAFAGKA